MVGELLADADVVRNTACAVVGEQLGGQGVDQDAAVGGAVERDLAQQAFERARGLAGICLSVVRREVEDRQMAAADHLAEDRLPAAAAVEAEPASAGLHVACFDRVGGGIVTFEGLCHLGRIAQARVLEARARQNLVADEKEILVADFVMLEKVLAVGNAAAHREIVCGLRTVTHAQQAYRRKHPHLFHDPKTHMRLPLS